MTPHPQRCETCKNKPCPALEIIQKKPYSDKFGTNYWWDKAGLISSLVGCASHSSAKSEQKQCAYWGCKDGKNCCSLLIPDPALYVELTDIIRKDEREKVLDEFKWMRPMCFGRHEAICDTRCAWAVRKRCVAELRSKQGEP